MDRRGGWIDQIHNPDVSVGVLVLIQAAIGNKSDARPVAIPGGVVFIDVGRVGEIDGLAAVIADFEDVALAGFFVVVQSRTLSFSALMRGCMPPSMPRSVRMLVSIGREKIRGRAGGR